MPSKAELRFDYNYCWEVVIEGYFSKYREVPNPIVPDVFNLKYSQMDYDSTADIVTFNRITQIHIHLPDFLKRIAGVDHMEFETDVTICRRERWMRCVTKNATFWPNIQLVEHTHHYANPDNPEEQTIFTVEAELTFMNLLGLQGAVEKAAIDSAKKGQKVARREEKPYFDEINSRPGRPGVTELEEQCKEQAKLKKSQEDLEGKHSLGDFESALNTTSFRELYKSGCCVAPLAAAAGAGAGAGARRRPLLLLAGLGRALAPRPPPPDYPALARAAVARVLEDGEREGGRGGGGGGRLFSLGHLLGAEGAEGGGGGGKEEGEEELCTWRRAAGLAYPCLAILPERYKLTTTQEKGGLFQFKWFQGIPFSDAKQEVDRKTKQMLQDRLSRGQEAKVCMAIKWNETANYSLFQAIVEALEENKDGIAVCFIYAIDDSFMRCWRLTSPDFSNEMCRKFFFLSRKREIDPEQTRFDRFTASAVGFFQRKQPDEDSGSDSGKSDGNLQGARGTTSEVVGWEGLIRESRRRGGTPGGFLKRYLEEERAPVDEVVEEEEQKEGGGGGRR